MKPGRELDALVAERVFGHHVVDQNGIGAPGKWVVETEYIRSMVPLYSTDITAALEVACKLKLWVYPMRFGWLAGQSDSNEYVAYDGSSGITTIDGSFYNCAFEETAPHAICLAALKAVGVL